MNGSTAVDYTQSVEGPQDAITMPEKVLTKVDQRTAGLDLAQRLLEQTSSLEGYVLLRQMREIIETAEKQLSGAVTDKAIGQTQNVGGALVQARRKAAKWDYHQDSVINNLRADADLLKEQIKEQEKFLQSLPMEVADTETGETRKPATKMPDEFTVAVTFPKGGE